MNALNINLHIFLNSQKAIKSVIHTIPQIIDAYKNKIYRQMLYQKPIYSKKYTFPKKNNAPKICFYIKHCFTLH